MTINRNTAGLGAALALAAGAPAGISAEKPSPALVQVERIWNAAPHCAFTDLIRHDGAWWCVFRESTTHVPGSNGVIRVLRSADGSQWSSAAEIRERGVDLRDPKISVMPDGRLMLLMGGSIYAGEESRETRKFSRAQTRVAFSRDGRDWTSPQPVSVTNQWLWRVTWHAGAGHGFSYNLHRAAAEPSLALWRTTNGIDYSRLTVTGLPATPLSETSIQFTGDGSMIAVARGEPKSQPAWIGRSQSPFTNWTWVEATHPAQGPGLVVLSDGRMFYGARDFPGSARTVFGALTPTDVMPLLTLPSGGDSSYPGLVWHDGMVWMSYYASHEGSTAIYLARIRP